MAARASGDDDVLDRPPPPADHRLAYGAQPDQFGELRLPRGGATSPAPCPVAVVIHGGFWRARYDLHHISHLCAGLAADGIATWNLEYRRVSQPGGGWPGTFDDVVAGASYVASLARRAPLDLGRVVAVGHSAGGHLALWLAASRTRLPFALRGAVALAGVTDLRRAQQLGLSRGAVAELLGGPPEAVPERYAEASPRERLPLRLPQALVHGLADDTVPFELAESYRAAAHAAGDPIWLVALPRTGHFELIDPTSHAWPAVLATVSRLLAPAGGFPP